jgi:excisionase family DNA binding protein
MLPEEKPMPALRLHLEEDQDLLTAKQVAARLSISPRTLYRMVARGHFPQPVRYSRKLVRWPVRDLEEFLDALRREPVTT